MTAKLTEMGIASLAFNREHIIEYFPMHYLSIHDKIKLKCLVCNSK